MARAVSLQDVLDSALRQAAGRHWESVRLNDIAAELGCPLAEIRRLCRDKEALVDALWDRADAAMLARADVADLHNMEMPARIETLVFAWLQPLAAYRRTVREMLLVRLEPGHLHIQLPTLIRVSRSVQWLREAAGLRATFAWRAMEESALSALFVATVAAWLQDSGEHRARRLLRGGLHAGDVIRTRIGPRDEIRTGR